MVQDASQGALKTGAAMAAVRQMSRPLHARHDTCSMHTTATHHLDVLHAACSPRDHTSQEGLCMPAPGPGTAHTSHDSTQGTVRLHTQNTILAVPSPRPTGCRPTPTPSGRGPPDASIQETAEAHHDPAAHSSRNFQTAQRVEGPAESRCSIPCTRTTRANTPPCTRQGACTSRRAARRQLGCHGAENTPDAEPPKGPQQHAHRD